MLPYLPSAGMIRIRCCGSSVKRSSQPVERTPRWVLYRKEYKTMDSRCQVKTQGRLFCLPWFSVRDASILLLAATHADWRPNQGLKSQSASD